MMQTIQCCITPTAKTNYSISLLKFKSYCDYDGFFDNQELNQRIGLPARPIPGRDVLVKPSCTYKCYNPDCRRMSSPINVYINHLKVVHGVNIRDQSMTSLERNRYLPV